MCVANTSDVLRCRAVFDCEASLTDEFTCQTVDDVDAKQFVSSFACQYFHEASVLAVCLRTRVRGESEFTFLVLHALSLELLLSLPDPGDFGIRVYHGWNAIVIQMG